MGALTQLELPSTWHGDDAAVLDAQQRASRLIEMCGTSEDACEWPLNTVYTDDYDFTTGDHNCVIPNGVGSYESGVGFVPVMVQSGFSFDARLEMWIPCLPQAIACRVEWYAYATVLTGVIRVSTIYLAIDPISAVSVTKHVGSHSGGYGELSMNIGRNDFGDLAPFVLTMDWSGYALEGDGTFKVVAAHIAWRA